jgi:hypothetical protein
MPRITCSEFRVEIMFSYHTGIKLAINNRNIPKEVEINQQMSKWSTGHWVNCPKKSKQNEMKWKYSILNIKEAVKVVPKKEIYALNYYIRNKEGLWIVT